MSQLENTSGAVRSTFTTSRQLEFFSESELSKQTGHSREQWPRVILKELIDNSLDACDELGTAPEIEVRCDKTSIEVADNGGGIPADTVAKMLNFTSRTSSRSMYVAPDRGSQGNALKTLTGIAHVIGGILWIESQGVTHRIAVTVDVISQSPIITHEKSESHRKIGTLVRIEWPEIESEDWPIGSEKLEEEKIEIWWQILGFAAVNPHLTIRLEWYGETEISHIASNPGWEKWTPSLATSAHWYEYRQFVGLAAAYVNSGRDMLVRDFIALFDGLARTAKRKAVLDAVGLHRVKISDLLSPVVNENKLSELLESMKLHSKAVNPKALGVIGRDHLSELFKIYGGADSFRYKKVEGHINGIPHVVECAFARLKGMNEVRFVTGANFSSGINDLFARCRGMLDDLSDDDPVLIFTHIVGPKLNFADRGKSLLQI
jgi:DNA topoisomerase VI subunit B